MAARGFWQLPGQEDPVGRAVSLQSCFQTLNESGLERGVEPTDLHDFLAQEVDSSLNTELTTPEELSKLIHASRK